MTPNEQQKAAALEWLERREAAHSLTPYDLRGEGYPEIFEILKTIRALLQPTPTSSEVAEAIEKITRELDLTHHMETVGTDMIHVSRDNLETLISAAQEAGRLRCCQELSLLGNAKRGNIRLTKKGRRYLFWAYHNSVVGEK